MGHVPLSCVQWLFPPLVMAPSREPGHLSWQSRWLWMLGSISHHGEMVGFGTLVLGLSHATSPHKRGMLVPRHCRSHSSRTYAERRGTRVWPLVLCSDQGQAALHFWLKDSAGPFIHGGRMQCSGGLGKGMGESTHGTDPSVQSSPGQPGVSSWTAWH